ncbi:hypothetical protein D3C85_904080 [compost metagenome]
MLGSRVDTHFRRSPKTGHRSGIDDGPAPLGKHQRQLVLHAQPDALDVDAHDCIELIEGALRQPALFDLDPGIVEGIIEAAISVHCLGHQVLHVTFQGHVAAHEHRLTTGRTDQLDGAFTARHIEVRDDYFQSLGGKCLGGRTANTGRRTCHQRYLAGKSHAHCYVLERWA